MDLKDSYIKTLKARNKESRVYRDYQLTGLEIAEILHDEGHKSLYIKLAKDGQPGELLRLAKEIAEKKDIMNKGAYFMKVIKNLKDKRKN